MAKSSKHSETAAATGTGETGETVAPDMNAPEGWTEVGARLPLYQADKGRGGPVRGVLLCLRSMPPANGKPWEAFVIECTIPVRVVERDDSGRDIPRTAEPGEQILVPATMRLREFFGRAANHPRYAFEVYFRPSGTQKTPKGSMVLYEMRRNPKPILRSREQAVLAIEASAPQPLTLAAAAAPDGGSDDIPF